MTKYDENDLLVKNIINGDEVSLEKIKSKLMALGLKTAKNLYNSGLLKNMEKAELSSYVFEFTHSVFFKNIDKFMPKLYFTLQKNYTTEIVAYLKNQNTKLLPPNMISLEQLKKYELSHEKKSNHDHLLADELDSIKLEEWLSNSEFEQAFNEVAKKFRKQDIYFFRTYFNLDGTKKSTCELAKETGIHYSIIRLNILNVLNSVYDILSFDNLKDKELETALNNYPINSLER